MASLSDCTIDSAPRVELWRPTFRKRSSRSNSLKIQLGRKSEKLSAHCFPPMTKNNKQDSTTLMQQAIATLLAAQANLANVHVTLISSQARSDERFARFEERLGERFERIDQRFNDIENRLA